MENLKELLHNQTLANVIVSDTKSEKQLVGYMLLRWSNQSNYLSATNYFGVNVKGVEIKIFNILDEAMNYYLSL